MKKYNEKIHTLLSYLYQFRVLTYDQIYQSVFSDCTDSYCQKILKSAVSEFAAVCKNGFYLKDSYYTISRTGITLLKSWGIIRIEDKNEVIFPDKLLSSSDIKLADTKVSHQLALNQFVLDFFATGIPAKYYDEIYVSSIFRNIRPDGVLLIGNTCYFLEMDMATERKQRLMQKWESYRNFLTSGEQEKLGYKIRVLFIIESADITTRTKNLEEYILDNLSDFISPTFNIYIGKSQPLLSLIQKQQKKEPPEIVSLLQDRGFSVTSGLFKTDMLSGYSYRYYVYKKRKDGGIETVNGIPVEFVLDDATGEVSNLLVAKNTTLYPSFAAAFGNSQGRNIPYVVSLPSVRDAYHIQKIRDTFDYDISFITPERFSKMPIFEALFSIDRYGNYWHYKKDNPKIRIEEGVLSSL